MPPSPSFNCSTPTPDSIETYPGTSGKTHGERNEITPARNTPKMETSIRLPSYFRRFLTYQAVATDCTQTRIFPHPLDALLLIFGSWQRANSKTVAAFCHRGPLLRIDWRDCRKAILNLLRHGKA